MTTTVSTSASIDVGDDLAAPLDALLVEAALGPIRASRPTSPRPGWWPRSRPGRASPPAGSAASPQASRRSRWGRRPSPPPVVTVASATRRGRPTPCCAGSSRPTSRPAGPPSASSPTPSSTGATTSAPGSWSRTWCRRSLRATSRSSTRRRPRPSRHGRPQCRPRGEGVRLRPGFVAAHPGDGRPHRFRARPEHRGQPGSGRPAHRGLRAPPVHPDDAAGPRGTPAVRPPDDQQVLRDRPRSRPQPGRVPGRHGAAGVRDVVAQPGGRARGLGHRHLRLGDPRGDGRGRTADRYGAGGAHRDLLGRDPRVPDRGLPRRHRAAGPAGGVLPAGHRARQRAGRPSGCLPGAAAGGSREAAVPPPGVPRRPGARRGLRLAAAGRPGVELLGEQLPARQEAAGVRHPVLERRHDPDAGRAARRLHRHRDREPARAARRSFRARHPRGPVPRHSRRLRRRRDRRPHHALAELLRHHPAPRREHPVRALHERPHRGPGEPPEQPQGDVPDRQGQPHRPAGLAARGPDARRELVARLRRLARRALRRPRRGTGPPRRARPEPLDEAPGSYVFET